VSSSFVIVNVFPVICEIREAGMSSQTLTAPFNPPLLPEPAFVAALADEPPAG
jgi:hypothetical protein